MTTAAPSIPGYDIARVEAWIGAHIPELAPPFHWLRLEGGHSNLTYKLTDAQGREAVIRRPPMGELLPRPMTWDANGRSSRRWAQRPCRCRLPTVFAKTPRSLALTSMSWG